MFVKKITLLFLSVCFSSLTCAQSEAVKLDSSASKYASEINEQSAKKHLSVLASDEFEGRDTGKPGGKKAAAYIAEEFKRVGLAAPIDDQFLQPVDLIETPFTVKEFKINGKSYATGEGFFIVATGEERTVKEQEIVFIGYGISSAQYDDLEGVNLTDKVVVLINEGEPNKNGISYITNSKQYSAWSTQRNKRLQEVLAQKPQMIFAVSSETESMISTLGAGQHQSRMMLRSRYKPAESTTGVAHITYDLANQLLKRSGRSFRELQAQINRTGKPITQVIKAEVVATYGTSIKEVKSDNVLGYLEGTDLKDELVVISAHYDHVGIENGEIYNGADDDGSGTTALLEMARAFQKSKNEGHGPRRSVLFLAVTAEEKGLLGSAYYTDHPVYPLSNTVTNLNIDMIGRVDPAHESNPEYIYLIGSDKLSSELHSISEEVNTKFTKLTLDYKYNAPDDPERIYYRSDHYNFAKHGIPVIFYFNGVHADYHKPTDTIDKIDFGLLVKRSKLVFHTAWEVANRDKRPVVDSNKK